MKTVNDVIDRSSQYSQTHVDDDGRDWYKIASYGDYHGSTVDVANIKWFDENMTNHSDLSRFVDGCYGYVTDSLWVRTDSTDKGIVGALKSLGFYPILDEDIFYEVEEGLVEDSWGEYLYIDFNLWLTGISPQLENLRHDSSDDSDRNPQLELWHLINWMQQDINGGELYIIEGAHNVHWYLDDILTDKMAEMIKTACQVAKLIVETTPEYTPKYDYTKDNVKVIATGICMKLIKEIQSY